MYFQAFIFRLYQQPWWAAKCNFAGKIGCFAACGYLFVIGKVARAIRRRGMPAMWRLLRAFAPCRGRLACL
jgi:hypothetical protein